MTTKIPDKPITLSIRSVLCGLSRNAKDMACENIQCSECVLEAENWETLTDEEAQLITVDVLDLFTFEDDYET